ncbi:MAG: PTS sugar transporter subunit IIB [Candidatus Asgardarchaeia archaeon]
MKKVKILVACALGASISFFSQKLKEAAKKRGYELDITERTIDQVHREDIKKYDLVLIAPQVKFHIKSIKERAGDVPVIPIDNFTYAIMDGERGFKNLILPHIEQKGSS